MSGQIKVWSIIIQEHLIASGSGWGGYTGMEPMWLPVARPLGTAGRVITFEEPYPCTVNLMGTYTLKPPLHIFDNLRVVTWVQSATGTREVLNADYMDLPDSTGVYEDTFVRLPGSAALHVAPTPPTAPSR